MLDEMFRIHRFALIIRRVWSILSLILIATVIVGEVIPPSIQNAELDNRNTLNR